MINNGLDFGKGIKGDLGNKYYIKFVTEMTKVNYPISDINFKILAGLYQDIIKIIPEKMLDDIIIDKYEEGRYLWQFKRDKGKERGINTNSNQD